MSGTPLTFNPSGLKAGEQYTMGLGLGRNDARPATTVSVETGTFVNGTYFSASSVNGFTVAKKNISSADGSLSLSEEKTTN